MEQRNLSGSESDKKMDNGPVSETIQVVEENITVSKETVVTGKVRIHKTVTEETTSVDAPIINDEYIVERVKVSSGLLDTPPPAMRTEGDDTIITVLREVTVVQKKYEIIEEIHVRRTSREFPLTHEVTLKKEKVEITRTDLSE